ATLSPELYYPGGILMAEHQVMSWLPKHHSHKRDFVSHPNAELQLRARRASELKEQDYLRSMLSRRQLQALLELNPPAGG
ncbi:MAG: hypothetical protein LC776_11360, partial [Acidobacteria bacterium]|nr:hypothetical protein [Acidobacteriota bacterium]